MVPWGLPRLRRGALVRTTVASRPQAEALARRLVERRLAACVHVSELASTYHWKGRMETEPECLVEARTLAGRAAARVAEALAEGHPYELPLVEVIPVALGASYHEWLRAELRQPDQP